MKYLLIIFTLAYSAVSFAQKDTPVIRDAPIIVGDVPPAIKQHDVFVVVEYMLEYPGGEDALMRFIQKNIQYPKMEKESDIQGRVIIKFIVNEDGSLSDITVKKSVSPGLDNEALRVVKLMPKFKPGIDHGKTVRVQFMLPIMFKLAPFGSPKKKQ